METSNMQTTNVNIDLNEVADEASLCGRSAGIRRMDSPNFIFFDDEDEIDPDLKAFRDTVCDYEQWLGEQPEYEFEETVDLGFFTVHRDQKPWDKQSIDKVTERFFENQEARSYCNWLVQFHKRRPRTNDGWHKAFAAIAAKCSTDEELRRLAQVKKTVGLFANFAPGPVAKTVFRNPDGTRHETAGTDFGRAKSSFIAAQKKRGNDIDPETVMVERVQLVGERTSRIVVGQRRLSNQTPSNYYDPNPAFTEESRKEGYIPCATTLYLVGDRMVMPADSHRLTIRELERAIIAGADLVDDPIDFDLDMEEDNRVYDIRVSGIESGWGKEHQDPVVLTEEEQTLYGFFTKLQEEGDPIWTWAGEMMLQGATKDQFHALFSDGQGYGNEYARRIVNRATFMFKEIEAITEADYNYIIGVMPELISTHEMKAARLRDEETADAVSGV